MKRSRLAGLAGIFLAVMLLFTVLSRAADSAGIANVTLGRPQNMMIAHEVRGSGRVVQNQERAVVTEPNQRVGAVYVNEGQQVEKGDVLFELDMNSLKENIQEKKQDIRKLELQLQDTASQEAVSEKQRANAQEQASEGYSLSVSRASVSLSHAQENLTKARRELAEYRKKKGAGGEETLAEQELEQFCEECSAAYVQAQQDLQTLQWRIEKAVDDALLQAGQNGVEGGALVRTFSDSTAECMPNGQIKTESAETFADPVQTYDDPLPVEISEVDDDIWIDSVVIEEIEPDDASGNDMAGENAGSGNSAGEGGQQGSGQWTPGAEDSPSGEGIGTGSGTGDDGAASGNDAVFRPPTSQELDQIEQEVREQYSEELEAAKKAVDEALKRKQEAEAALEDCRQKMLSAQDGQSAEQEQQLIDAVKAAQMAYEDAAIAANEAAVTGKRQVETAGLPEAENSAGDIYEMDLAQKKRELAKLRKLKKAKGQIKAPVDGIVTGVHVTTGERTPDGTAVMLADLTKGCRMTAEIPQEQETYIGRGDLVTIKSGDGKTTLEEIPVESVAVKAEDESVCLVTVQIPENKLPIGASAELSLTKKSAAYPLCIPLGALYLDEKNQPYVLTVQEINSVLGTEMQAFKVAVTVEDRNESYAALAQGSVSSSQHIIVSSDRPVSEGSRVRTAE